MARFHRTVHCLAAAALACLAGVSHAQNLVQNASFETPSDLVGPWYREAGAASIASPAAYDLSHFASFAAGDVINQSFSLGASGLYTVDFYAWGSGKSVLLDSATFNTIDITMVSDPTSSARITTLADSAVHSPERYLIDSQDATWSPYSYSFLGAAGKDYRLYFVGVGSAFAVDAVTVAAAVPEPESYAMMLAGLGALGFMARRRKQSQA